MQAVGTKASELMQRRLHQFRRWEDVEHIWSLDTEFQTVNGRPIPVSLCAQDLINGQRIEMFFQDGEQPVNPFADYEHSVFIGHSLAAEWSAFIAMGWELPPRCIDTLFEFACLTNEKVKRDLVTPATHGRSLLDACEYFGISSMDHTAKTDERQNIIAHGRIAPDGVDQAEYERRVMDYCLQDVGTTGALFMKMVPLLDSSQSMLRGSYSRVVAWFQYNGLPLNFAWVKKVIKYRDYIKLELVRRIEERYQYGAYKIVDGEVKFSQSGASAMVERMGLGKVWPRSPKTGQYSFARDVVEGFAKTNEELMPFYELRKTDSALKNFVLNVANDGYNRVYVAPFGTKTGRNNPGGGFILAGPKWLRFGVQAPEGHVLIAVDVKAEEFVLAAAFGENQAEMETYYSNRDLYMDLAIRLNAAPPEANHETEPDAKKRKAYAAIRKKYKTITLGSQYGQGPTALAAKVGVSELEGQVIVADLRRLRKPWWDFSGSQISAARRRKYIQTVFGWQMQVNPEIRRGRFTVGTKTTTLVNWPIQAAGAEILRLASIYLERGGFGQYLCCPHHDAIYACAPKEKARKVAAAIEAAFSLAGDVVMDGKARLRMDTNFYPHPECYADKDGADLFRIVDEILAPLPDVTDEEWAVLQVEMERRIEANRRKKQGSKKAA